MNVRLQLRERMGLSDLSDAELVRRSREGDVWARDMIFRRHVVAVTGTVVRLLGDREEAKDVVQDTFAEAFKELERLRDPIALRAWLLRIAVNNLHRILRRRR